jgi:hypothetical protein
MIEPIHIAFKNGLSFTIPARVGKDATLSVAFGVPRERQLFGVNFRTWANESTEMERWAYLAWEAENSIDTSERLLQATNKVLPGQSIMWVETDGDTTFLHTTTSIIIPDSVSLEAVHDLVQEAGFNPALIELEMRRIQEARHTAHAFGIEG